ncbi:MAG: PKD domain-containing protein [Desulfococcaceae bacterium]
MNIYHKLVPILLCLSLLSGTAQAEENYRFIRMWPALQQPWYFSHPNDVATDSRGYVYVADTENHRVQKFTKDGQFVGQWNIINEPYFFNPPGIATDARDFVYVADGKYIQKYSSDGRFVLKWGLKNEENFVPMSVETDGTGLVYVTDTANFCFHVFTEDGQNILSYGSNGSGNGQFLEPLGIAADRNGNVYVTDAQNHCVQKFQTEIQNGILTARFVSRWGTQGKADGQFDIPVGICTDNEYVYVVDQKNDRVQKFDFNGNFISKWGKEGSGDGEFYAPAGVVADKNGYVYVAGKSRNRIQKFTSSGQFVANWESRGSRDGFFEMLSGISLLETGGETRIFVADKNNDRIQKFDENGQHLQTWEKTENGEPLFDMPFDIAVNSSFAYVTDNANNRILKFSLSGEFLGKWGESGAGNGQFANPQGIALDEDGNVYVADTSNERIQIFDANGNFVRTWGEFGYAPGQLSNPKDILVRNGVVYVTDYGDRIQKFDTQGKYIPWEQPDIAQYKFFSSPLGIAADNAHIYIADSENHRIVKFTLSGTFVSAFGKKGTSPGFLNTPTDMAVASDGKIYVSDKYNNRIQVFDQIQTAEKTKAIVVAGGGAYAGNTLWDATRLCANFAVRALSFQGLVKEDIRYLTSDTQLDLDNDGVPDEVISPSAANLRSAVEWSGDADLLVLYMVNHGGKDDSGKGFFRMSGTEILSAGELDAVLDAFQQNLSCKVIVVYDACKSGTFPAEPAAPEGKERIVITSTSPDEDALFISQGANSFSLYFWTNIFNGSDVQAAFAYAEQDMLHITASQHPMMTGNGTGLFIGNGCVLYGERPVLTNLHTAADNAGILTVEAKASDDDGIARVWAVIRPPETSVSADASLLELPSVEMKPAGSNTYIGEYENAVGNGDYRITLYARDRNGNISLPEEICISSGASVKRKAVIIAGGPATSPQWESIENNTAQAYNSLRFQGYGDDEIYCISPVTTVSGVDADALLRNVQYAVETWGAENTLDLVVYITGIGSRANVQINDSESLSAKVLDTWLDNVQQKIPGIVTVIYDGDYAGTFLPLLTPQENRKRIVICAASADQTANFNAPDALSFSAFFWKNILCGLSTGRAFADAADAMAFALHTRADLPLLDDNGNGRGNERGDGYAADEYIIGAGIRLAENLPAVGEAVPETVLAAGESALLWAADVNATGTLKKVWAVLIPPNPTGSAPFVLPNAELTWNPDAKRYEAVYSNFPFFGNYTVSIYAENTDGNISLARETTVFCKNGKDVYENDDTAEQASLIVISEENPQQHNLHDSADQDWVKFYGIAGKEYTISMLADDESVSVQMFDSTQNELEFSQDWICPQNGVYYLKITATEGQEISVSYNLRIYRPVGVFAGFVRGWIAEASGVPVANAVIRTSANASAVAGLNGRYMMIQEPGTFDITIEAEGYYPFTGKITVGEGGTTLTDFTMKRIVPPVPVDLIPAVSIVSPAADVAVAEGESVSFQGNVTGGDAPFSYFWNFGGGAENSHVLNPGNVIFPKPGTYTVIFTVTDADGDLHSASVTVTVKEKEIPDTVPEVSIAAFPNSCGIPCIICFEAEITGGNPPFICQWNFGDGQANSDCNAVHTFIAAGNYTVTLTVTDADGDIAEDSVMITVAEGETPVTPDDTEPAAEITSPSADVTIAEGESVLFAGNVQSGNKPFTYHWDFGTAGNSSEKNPGETAFAEFGEYTVTFTVTDADGDTDSASVKITVKEPDVPVQPVLPETLYPENGKTDVSLTPVLTAGNIADSSFSHLQTNWQISTDENFSFLILDITDAVHLTAFPVPDLVLKPDTVYYWRVQFRESSGNLSEWSETVSFTTSADNSDADDSGIPDDLQTESDDPEMKCVKTKSGRTLCVKGSLNVNAVEFLTAADTAALSEIPGEMPFGLAGFRIFVNEPGAAAEIVIHLSESVPSGSKWHEYDSANGWNDISYLTATDRTNRIITLKITDSGNGDADGTANGIIVNFSGPVIPALRNLSVSGPDSGNAGGCFINSLAF